MRPSLSLLSIFRNLNRVKDIALVYKAMTQNNKIPPE